MKGKGKVKINKKRDNTGSVMHSLNREVQNQYLPPKIRQKQYEDNPEKFEKIEKERTKAHTNFSSTLEYGGGAEEYLSIAKMSNKKYEALQEHQVLQNIHCDTVQINPNELNKILLENTLKNSDLTMKEQSAIQIPRRPKYVKGMKPKEFENLENEAFLNWRRALAEVEISNEKAIITPFEKNISVWRQLWITIEKCQVLIQIVDARNPLFFRSADLEMYIKSIDNNKEYLLLVNKADLLSEELRISWADYFKKNGINFMFFSALVEDEKLLSEEDLKKQLEEALNKNKNKEEEEDEESDEENEDNTKTENTITKEVEKEVVKVEVKELVKEEIKDNSTPNEILSYYSGITKDDYKIYNREELIAVIKKISNGKEKNQNSKAYMIGFIGFPNVGKSSVINVLMQKKKVGVAMMPGKTKHYQTLFLPDDNEICLMDCPGLVFPTFTFSKADLVIQGIVPIDKIVDFLMPIQLIIYNIPKPVLEKQYKIKLPDLYSASQFCQFVANKYGYLTGRSIPSEAKAAKIVLKDYVSGHLLYCYNRPDYNKEKHGEVNQYLLKYLVEENKNVNLEKEVDKLKENNELMKLIPADFNGNLELIGIEKEKEKLKDYDEYDNDFFNADKDKVQQQINDSKIPKDLKMELKFAMKRGDITEEDFESIETFGEAKELLAILAKEKADGTKSSKGYGQRKQVGGAYTIVNKD